MFGVKRGERLPNLFEQNPNIHIDFQPTLVHNNTPDQKRKWGHHAQDPDSRSHPRRHPIVPAHLHPRPHSSSRRSPPIDAARPPRFLAPLTKGTHGLLSATSPYYSPTKLQNEAIQPLGVRLTHFAKAHCLRFNKTKPPIHAATDTSRACTISAKRSHRPHCLPPIMHHPKRHETKPAPPPSNQPATHPPFFQNEANSPASIDN